MIKKVFPLLALISLIIPLFLLCDSGLWWPVCLYKQFTGFRCPLCGLTTSWMLTTHGRLSQAFTVYPLGPVFLFFSCLYILTRTGQTFYASGFVAFRNLVRSSAFINFLILMILCSWLIRGLL